MKRKGLITSIVAVGAAAVFTISSFAATNNVSGYEKVRDWIVNYGSYDSNLDDNIEVKMDIKISEGANQLAQGTLSTLVNAKEEIVYTQSTAVDKNGNPINNETWSSPERCILYDSAKDQYIVEEIPKEFLESYKNDDKRPHGPGQMDDEKAKKYTKAFLDILAGDMKTAFVVSGDKVQLNLESAQVPELVQLGTAFIMEMKEPEGKNDKFDFDSLDLIKFDASIQSVSAEFDLTQGAETASFKVDVEGRDSSGNRHVLTMEGNMSIKTGDIAKIELPDLEGKNVKKEELSYQSSAMGEGFTIIREVA